MDYYPRTRLHRAFPSTSIGSSNSQVESDVNGDLEVASDLSVDGSSTYILHASPLPSASPTSAVPLRDAFSAGAAHHKPLKLMPKDDSLNNTSYTGAIPGSSLDVMHDWECADADDSGCSIEEWDCCTSHDTVPLDEQGESSSTLDEDAWLVRRWDLIPEYIPLRVSRGTKFLRMHGRPLEAWRPPSEQTHRSVHHRATALPPAPHPRVRLPLFSILVSLLSIDDETVHLVTHSHTHSTLFPGPILPSDEGTTNAQETHGIYALLDLPSEHRALHDGLAVASDGAILPSNPFKLSVFPLTGLLDLVKGILVGGRVALREVYR
ncbi:hypothetical protein BC827DRAFT_1030 [Russula dissimulans]|nr:hypothetical protein BC827DRAFT_1030 [Russula dissimulans]